MPYQFLEFKQFYMSLTEWIQYIVAAIVLLNIPLPVGIIGGWRWSIWLFRKTIGLFYRAQPSTGYMTTTTVVIPVYNEDPYVFRLALRSWLANRPTELIAVIDHSDEKCIQSEYSYSASLLWF